MVGAPIEMIRYAADVGLRVPDLLGLRPYHMEIHFTEWAGRPGVGVPTVSTFRLTNGSVQDGYVNPRFRQVTKQEIVLSGNLLQDQDIVIGPLLFPYDTGMGETGGIDPDIFSDPIASVGSVTEMYINITGPNLPAAGNNYKKIWDATDRNVIYRVYLRNTGSK